MKNGPNKVPLTEVLHRTRLFYPMSASSMVSRASMMLRAAWSVTLSVVLSVVYCASSCHPFVVPSIAICRLSRCPLSIVASIRRPIHVVRRVFSICHVAMCCRLLISNRWFLIIRKINLYIIIFGLQTYFTNPKTSLNRKKRAARTTSV